MRRRRGAEYLFPKFEGMRLKQLSFQIHSSFYNWKMEGEEVRLTSDYGLIEAEHGDYQSDFTSDNDYYSDIEEEALSIVSQIWDGEAQNILTLSLLLSLALITNLSAAPVILFRRTR